MGNIENMVIEKPRRGEEKYIGRNEKKKLKSFKTCKEVHGFILLKVSGVPKRI